MLWKIAICILGCLIIAMGFLYVAFVTEDIADNPTKYKKLGRFKDSMFLTTITAVSVIITIASGLGIIVLCVKFIAEFLK